MLWISGADTMDKREALKLAARNEDEEFLKATGKNVMYCIFCLSNYPLIFKRMSFCPDMCSGDGYYYLFDSLPYIQYITLYKI